MSIKNIKPTSLRTATPDLNNISPLSRNYSFKQILDIDSDSTIPQRVSRLNTSNRTITTSRHPPTSNRFETPSQSVYIKSSPHSKCQHIANGDTSYLKSKDNSSSNLLVSNILASPVSHPDMVYNSTFSKPIDPRRL